MVGGYVLEVEIVIIEHLFLRHDLHLSVGLQDINLITELPYKFNIMKNCL